MTNYIPMRLIAALLVPCAPSGRGRALLSVLDDPGAWPAILSSIAAQLQPAALGACSWPAPGLPPALNGGPHRARRYL